MTDLELKALYISLGVIALIYIYLSGSKEDTKDFHCAVISLNSAGGFIAVAIGFALAILLWPYFLIKGTIKSIRKR